MAHNLLLEEFASQNESLLKRRLVDFFDQNPGETEDEVVNQLKSELETILEERIDETNRNQT